MRAPCPLPVTAPFRPRHVGRSAVVRTIRRLRANWIAAKAKTRMPWIAVRPAASRWFERADRFGRAEIWGGGGGCLGGRQGGPLRRDGEEGRERSGRSRSGTAVRPGGDGDSGPFDLLDRHRPRSQQTEYDVDPTRDVAIAAHPAPDGSRVDVKQPGDAVLRDAEHVERRTEFGH
jgi:hypothetical protein